MPEPFVDAPIVKDLSPELQAKVRKVLADNCGTSGNLRLLGAKSNPEHLAHGQAVYARQCQPCHGVTGDGNGPAAAYLNPKPRDYRQGIFKFTSTPYGAKPVRADLVRTVQRGVTGTSMPSFNLLPQEDLDAVVDYVLALTHRGELEIQLAVEAAGSDELDPDVAKDLVASVPAAWIEAESQVVEPLNKMLPYTPENVAAGREAFLTRGCSKCHGADGRGRSKDNVGQDSWGNVAFAADLTSGMLHGGTQPKDIYRRIFSGINGTPMPAFQNALASEPDTIWHLVNYIEYVSSRRRQGEFPEFDPAAQNVTPGTPAAAEGEAETPPAESESSPAAEEPGDESAAPAETTP